LQAEREGILIVPASQTYHRAMPTSAPRPVGFTSHIASVNSVHLHYWLGGDPHRPPVLLWHGFLSTSLEWRRVMRLLAQAGYAVLVPNMRGYGDSDKPEGTAGYDARALAEEFRALVQQIGFGGDEPLLLAAHDGHERTFLTWFLRQAHCLARGHQRRGRGRDAAHLCGPRRSAWSDGGIGRRLPASSRPSR